MTTEQLTKANHVSEHINAVTKLLEATKVQKATWIEFTWGNGSDKSTVCTDEKTIEEIRQLLLSKHEETLANLKKMFSEL